MRFATHIVPSSLRRGLPGILAVALAAFGAVVPARAADAQMSMPSRRLIEITGGSGARAWRLRYGTWDDYKKLLVKGEGNRVWFSHAGWLRLIDTEKGQVMGRWHFPAQIVGLTPHGGHVQVEVEESYSTERRFRRTLEFDPAAPHVPYWPLNSLMLQRASRREAEMSFPDPFGPPELKTPVERAKQILPELEEAILRDPQAPWFRVALGRVLRDVGDPRAEAAFREAIRLPLIDFMELLPISAFLDWIGEEALARQAFDRGYQDSWQKGNDPRLLVVLMDRMSIYGPSAESFGDPASDRRRELIERMYRLMPGGEDASLAWELYANHLRERGRGNEAQVWRQRAQEARASEIWMFLPRMLWVDLIALIAFASAIAAVAYFFVLFTRYRPQHRLSAAALAFSGRRRSDYFNTVYWNRGERLAFLTIALIGWYATGLVGWQVRAILRAASSPISLGAGTLAGPVNIHSIQDRFPATPDRDLLLAVAYQQDRQAEEAVRLYRRLPQFAESWNNLGVVLKQEGKDQEARMAFEKALQLDPNLAEAALNLGRPPQNEWAGFHQKYLPGQPMLAPPKPVHFQRMFQGGGTGTLLLHALRGPFAGVSLSEFLGGMGYADVFPFASSLTIILPIGALVFAITFQFLVPSREVTQPPGRLQLIRELLVPGTSPGWSALGGVVLVAWCYLALQLVLYLRIGTPYFLFGIAVPNLQHAYGVPVSDSFNDVLALVNPSRLFIYLAPVTVFLANLGLVVRARRA